MPAVLKNAIDVGSRPYGKSAWDGKPGAVVSASPGAFGGFGATHHMRQSLVFLNVPVLQQPEAYLGGVDKLFDDRGGMANESKRGILVKHLTWAIAAASPPPLLGEKPSSCLDHVVVLGEIHLPRILAGYVEYYRSAGCIFATTLRRVAPR